MKFKYSKQWAVALMTAGLGSSAWAVPFLQLDIDGPHYYDTVTETIIAGSNPFSVRALINMDGASNYTTYYLSAAITPKVESGNDFGSFTIMGVEYQYQNGTMVWGIPPVDDSLKDIPTHDIFPTYFTELTFQIIPGQTVPAYNSQTDEEAPGTLYYVDFLTDVSGLLAGNSVHFDLYTYDATGKKVDAFAPFSHDAQSGTHGLIVTNDVPDGGTTLVLLGLGLGGLGYLRRKLA